jgi:hypothetical protein
MRLRRHARSARVRWNELVRGMPSLFVCGRDRGQPIEELIGSFLEHADELIIKPTLFVTAVQ